MTTQHSPNTDDAPTRFPAGVLHNTATDRYHPIVFRPAPMPSGVDVESGALRHKSRGHHTEGFPSMAEADAHIAARDAWVPTGLVWEWNGDGVPALVHWFVDPVDGGARRGGS